MIDVYGIGNALLDITVRISDEELQSFGFEKGTMRLVTPQEQNDLIKQLGERHMELCSAGSVANSIYTVAQLGGRPGFTGLVGDDRYGLFYKGEFEGLEIDFGNNPVVGASTGTCLVLITPDGERTMRTSLGIASELAAPDILEETIERSRWIFLEGYLLANQEHVGDLLAQLVHLKEKHNKKLAFTCSEKWVIEAFRHNIDFLTPHIDLLFANEGEGAALAGTETGETAIELLGQQFPLVAVTLGERGVGISGKGKIELIPTAKKTPVDLTGAGDAFAGGLLYGITNGKSVTESAQLGCHLAGKVISHIGARLPSSESYRD